MGGKSQQRVAGNAKPASSGRIRELLINQQQGASNIITFSALSNSQRFKQQPQQADQSNRSNNSERIPGSVLKKHESTPPLKDNSMLVMKRVGDRSHYTKIKFADNVAPGDESNLGVLRSEAGVKKAPYALDKLVDCPDRSNLVNNDAQCETIDSNTKKSEVPTAQEDPEELYNFDQLLDSLAELKDSLNQNFGQSSLHELDSNSIESELHLLRVMKILIKKFSDDLSIVEWDLVVGSIHKWIGWISRSEQPLREMFHVEFIMKVLDFMHNLIMMAENIKKERNLDDIAMLRSLVDDWGNFHTSDMFHELLVLYFKLISKEMVSDSSDTNTRAVIEALASIILRVDAKTLLSHNSLLDNLNTITIEPDPDYKSPPKSIYCNIDENKFEAFLTVCGLLRSDYRVILASAHSMLRKSMDSICEDAQLSTLISSQDHDDVDDLLIFPPLALMSTLTSRDSMMSALFSDYRVGDISVTIDPQTDSYAITLAYLFTWDLVIQFIVGVDKEVGQTIIHSLKKLGLIQRLLDNVFILLPPLGERDSLSFKIEQNQEVGESSVLSNETWCLKDFLKNPLATTVKRPINEIELVALHIYFSVALHMPVTVRKWYNNNSNRRLCNLVNEYTVKHVSQIICSLEMESVQEKCQERAGVNQSNNLVIKARPSAKEVYAIYIRDEFKMELTIKLPINYPLGPVQIDGGKRVGVTDVKWRSWLLQLTTFLAHQNGPILDGIDLWRRNIDKRFEGIEKCTICFSILHSNYQLPKKKCQTCANMFHNLCLYKWFESSGNSTCPLCRNAW